MCVCGCTYLTGNDDANDPRIQNENKHDEDKNNPSDFSLILCQREELHVFVIFHNNLYWMLIMCVYFYSALITWIYGAY